MLAPMTGSMTRIDGLLLDLDGTLADSLGVMRLAYSKFLARWQLTGSDAEFQALNGPPLGEVVRELAATHGLSEPIEDLMSHYEGTVQGLYRDVAPTVGAGELLAAARRHSCSTAVVTSSTDSIARSWLQQKHLHFDALVSAESVSTGKPDPEPYERALGLLNCEAGRAVAVEDSPSGARSAVAAGVRTFVVSAQGVLDWPEQVLFVDGLLALRRELWGV